MSGETPLQRRIQKGLRKRYPGCFVRKLHVSDFSSAGLPDLLVIVEGYAFLLEVKPQDGEPSILQIEILRQIRIAGAPGVVVRSPGDAYRIIDHVLELRGNLRPSIHAWLVSFWRKWRGYDA